MENTPLICNIRQQSHKFNRHCNGMLADCRATALSSAQNFALPARQFFEQFDIFIIDEHRSGTLSTHHQRVFFLNVNSRLGLLSLLLFRFFVQRGHFVTL